jgi:hypothetical protein
MPKFYVQSGSLELITTATDPGAAAIWAVHRTLSPAFPFLSDQPAGESRRECTPGPQLAETITVSEQGFAGTDRVELKTLAVVTEWAQLLVAVDRLQQRLAAH